MHEDNALTTLAAVLAVVLMTMSPAIVAADEGDLVDDIGQALGDDDDGLVPDAVEAFASGLADRAVAFVSGGGSDTTASEAESGVRTFANDHSGAFVDYANAANYSIDDTRDTVRVVYKIDGETDSHVVEASHDNGSLTALSVVNTTTRTVDYECTLSGDLARNAPDELRTFYNDFVRTNDTDASPFFGRLAGRYGADNPCTEV